MPSSSSFSVGKGVSLVFTVSVALVSALFYSNFQSSMANATAPTKQWADGPMPLVSTPQFTTGKNDTFIAGASHMALVHNAIFRGFNSIYLQAPYVAESDYPSFIGYALAWHKFVHGHHDDEEENLFPVVENVLGQKGIWEGTIQEHETFLPGLARYHDYLTAASSKPSIFDGTTLREIMDLFADPFAYHFHSEIETIASMNSLPQTYDPTAVSLTFKKWGKSSIMKAGMTDVVPFLFMNFDRSDGFENGMWKAWPPMPAPIRWGLTNIGGSWNWGWWKFASCDAAGMPRELYALQHVDEGVDAVPALKVEL